MRNISDIKDLLTQLDTTPATDLESQDLEFKEWDATSIKGAVDTVVEYAICMANGGGGTVVFGVHDKATGRFRLHPGHPGLPALPPSNAPSPDHRHPPSR